MADIVYNSLTALQPVKLKYDYYRNEVLQTETLGYQEGYNFFKITGLEGFQDSTINKNSCFILTSAVSLSTLFLNQTELNIGKLPGNFKLQKRNTSLYYAHYSSQNYNFTFNSTDGNNFFLVPINNTTNAVEIRIGNRYLQFDAEYPFTIRLDEKIIVEEEKYRQTFYYTYMNGLISFRVKTNLGDRFLGVGGDNILRATGVILNESTVTEYIFKCVPVTENTLQYNFKPNNSWVTYFLDFPNQINNSDVIINKVFTNTPVNYLIDFPVEEAIKNNEIIINVANLKTGFTPAGGPSPVDNSYEEAILTSN